jgi:pimeloyl-ACP methyl ester carboxylesterase
MGRFSHLVTARSEIRVQFIHGLEGSPQGSKARLFAEHFETITPEMDTSSFEGSVDTQAAALSEFHPDILVGSSFGGAVAVELLARRLWQGPTMLLAQAAIHYDPAASLPLGIPVWLVHGTGDTLIDPEQSRRLAATANSDDVRLIEVDDDHPLHASVASGAIIDWVKELVATTQVESR